MSQVALSEFQSTHPHGVRLMSSASAILLMVVSIHAPAWGATSVGGVGGIQNRFQSTHPHGVRLVENRARTAVAGFNPRTRMGCDRSHYFYILVLPGFNPRTRMGCDQTRFWRPTNMAKFQSTHPHGVRPVFCANLSGRNWFQSTHPHGVRLGKRRVAPM